MTPVRQLEFEGGAAFGLRDAAVALAAWRLHCMAGAIHELDRTAVQATEAPRSLVFELLARRSPERDLYNACASLGRLLAEAGASPSLATATLDGAEHALAAVDVTYEVTHLGPARACLAEGYVAAISESEKLIARLAWEYPKCAVRVNEKTVAIVRGLPASEDEDLADWAARVSVGASREGFTTAIFEGPDATRTHLEDAFSLLGIALAPTAKTRTSVAPRAARWSVGRDGRPGPVVQFRLKFRRFGPLTSFVRAIQRAFRQS